MTNVTDCLVECLLVIFLYVDECLSNGSYASRPSLASLELT